MSKKNNSERHNQAVERENAWRKLSFSQQLSELDNRLGKDVGAKKQRARIKLAMTKSEKKK